MRQIFSRHGHLSIFSHQKLPLTTNEHRSVEGAKLVHTVPALEEMAKPAEPVEGWPVGFTGCISLAVQDYSEPRYKG